MQASTEIQVRGYHVDVFGHVNHARYVEFLEEARWAFFDRHQPVLERLHTRGIFHAVVRLELNYCLPARVGDRLRIETAIEEVGRTSAVVAQRIFRGEELIADVRITNAFLDRETGHAVAIRDELLLLSVESQLAYLAIQAEISHAFTLNRAPAIVRRVVLPAAWPVA
jgi:thioesterase-3